jgi:hypothetical protein
MSKHLHICIWLGYLEDVSSFARAPGRPALRPVLVRSGQGTREVRLRRLPLAVSITLKLASNQVAGEVSTSLDRDTLRPGVNLSLGPALWGIQGITTGQTPTREVRAKTLQPRMIATGADLPDLVIDSSEGSVLMRFLMRWGRGLAVNGVIAMREISVKLWRNDEFRDWSIEINGRTYEHVPDEGLTELVEAALIIAAKSLILESVNAGVLQGR